MAIERWELEQRQKGNITGAEMARVLRDQFGDVPLSSTERLIEVERFTPEAREVLEKEGYAIYTLTGKSIKDLRESGGKFWSSWYKGYKFESLPSMASEVAIDPDQLFLPESNRKTLAEQESMVEEFSKELGRKIKGVKAIIGEAPDYVELVFLHLEATGECLFGSKCNYYYARTKTPLGHARVALVGHFDDDALHVSYCHRGLGDDDVWAAPLVVSSIRAYFKESCLVDLIQPPSIFPISCRTDCSFR